MPFSRLLPFFKAWIPCREAWRKNAWTHKAADKGKLQRCNPSQELTTVGCTWLITKAAAGSCCMHSLCFPKHFVCPSFALPLCKAVFALKQGICPYARHCPYYTRLGAFICLQTLACCPQNIGKTNPRTCRRSSSLAGTPSTWCQHHPMLDPPACFWRSSFGRGTAPHGWVPSHHQSTAGNAPT